MSLGSEKNAFGAPAWIECLSAALVGNEARTCVPVLEALHRSGRLAPGELAPAAVLIAIVENAAGPGIIFTRRHAALTAHSGQVAFPGGAAEPLESVEQTALREAEEEIGLAANRVRLLGRLPRYPTTSAYLVTPVVGYVSVLPPLRPQPGEVSDIFTVPLGALLDPARWRSNPLRLGRERLEHRELDWLGRRIWGATAGMLQPLLAPLSEIWREDS